MMLDQTQEASRRVLTEEVVDAVEAEYNLQRGAIYKKSRRKQVAEARKVAYLLLRKGLNTSQSEIARLIGGRDHTTVLDGLRRIEKQIEQDADLRLRVSRLEECLFKPAKFFRGTGGRSDGN